MAEAAAEETDIRPVVRTAQAGNLGLWAFLVVLAVGGVMLFQTLDSRRIEATAPSTGLETAAGARIAAPPPLALPQAWRDASQPAYLPPPMQQQLPFQQQNWAPPPERIITRIVETPRQPEPAGFQQQQQQFPSGPAIVYDAAVAPVSAPAQPAAGASGEERVLATRLQNPSVTIPKGTIIPAVLETALDSTRSGAARAIVSRDVRSFDGSNILIPRGSQLYGEYEGDLNYGQNRALVRWTRLTRPDAVMINLESPSADPLGRAGIRGKVNSHFWSRFGSAILQSVLDIGVGVATRSVTDDAVILALPGSTQNIRNVATESQSQVRPTLTVKHGTRVSVFVAKDLDFSTVQK